jgi:protein-S-isoprenylcysteine O-methyltransferase Ste14
MSRSPLENPDIAQVAWSRYKRLLKRWSLVTLAVCIVLIAYLAWEFGLPSIHLYIASVLGIAGVIMLTVALMALLFLSSGTGHDESVDDRQ